jgi:hypothetical protein
LRSQRFANFFNGRCFGYRERFGQFDILALCTDPHFLFAGFSYPGGGIGVKKG